MLSKTKLDLSYQKFVLSLICQLPDENAIIWVDVNEMRDRLICGGVDRALSKKLLQIALHRANRGGNFLSINEFQKIQYYRPKSIQDAVGTPKDQRGSQSGQGVRNPPREYFLSDKVSPDTTIKVWDLNFALVLYENALWQYETQLETFETPTEESSKDDISILPLACDGRDCEGHDANGIFDISMLTQFIHASNTHLEEYGCAMDILVFDNEKGAHICEIWQCPRCRKCMELHSSRMIKTPVLEPGKSFQDHNHLLMSEFRKHLVSME